MISLRSIAVLTFIVVSTCTYGNYNNGDMLKGHNLRGSNLEHYFEITTTKLSMLILESERRLSFVGVYNRNM